MKTKKIYSLEELVKAVYPCHKELREDFKKALVNWADACIEASLIKAAENARKYPWYAPFGTNHKIDKSSITDPSNHVLL